MTERILLELSGEHPVLPVMEAEELFSAMDRSSRIKRIGNRLLLVESNMNPPRAEETCLRLALAREASRILFLAEDLEEVQLPPRIFSEIRGHSFVVRQKGLRQRRPEIERDIGARILRGARERGIQTSVSVDNPEVILNIVPTDMGFALAVLFRRPSRSSYRARAEARPFKKPVSMDPAIARAMVNISGVLEGESVLDPFCGTGNILVEAGIVGAEIYGMDFSSAMIEGTRLNLLELQSKEPLLVRGDAMRAPDLFRRTFDHILTDPPYGRASPSLTGPDRLLLDLPRISSSLLRSGGSLCMATPSTMDLTDRLVGSGLKLERFAYQRVHGSLGRHLYLARRA